MYKKYLSVILSAASIFIISGCVTSSIKSPHLKETTLTWFAYGSGKSFEDKGVKEEYKKKIDQYLLLHPQTSKEVTDKMKNCRVILGMTEEEVLLMAKPNKISRVGRNKKIFKYWDVGKYGWTKFIGEGVRTSVTFKGGVVTDISEINTTLGF